jgi:hypothetical protein
MRNMGETWRLLAVACLAGVVACGSDSSPAPQAEPATYLCGADEPVETFPLTLGEPGALPRPVAQTVAGNVIELPDVPNTQKVYGHIVVDGGLVKGPNGEAFIDGGVIDSPTPPDPEGCAPRAMGNAMAYLARRCGMPMIDGLEHQIDIAVHGHVNDGVGALVEDVETFLELKSAEYEKKGEKAYTFNRRTGLGGDLVRAKTDYVTMAKLPIRTTLAFRDLLKNPAGHGAFAKLKEALANGCIAELTFGQRTSAGNIDPHTLHTVTVTGVGEGVPIAKDGTLGNQITIHDPNGWFWTSGEGSSYKLSAEHRTDGLEIYVGKQPDLMIFEVVVECPIDPCPGSTTTPPGGGGNPDASAGTTRQPDASVSITPGTPTFTVSPISALFTQATFSTRYDLQVKNPAGEPIAVTWSGPNCGSWSPQGPQPTSTAAAQTATMTWSHPHPPCSIGTSHDDVTVVLEAKGPSGTVRCSHVGADSGTGPACTVVPRP